MLNINLNFPKNLYDKTIYKMEFAKRSPDIFFLIEFSLKYCSFSRKLKNVSETHKA